MLWNMKRYQALGGREVNKVMAISHNEIRKYIVLSIAIVLLIIGIILIFTKVQSEGSIDISVPLFSGKIESGSTGLLLIFLSIPLFVISLYSVRSFKTITTKVIENKSDTITQSEKSVKDYSYIKKLIAVLFGWIFLGLMGYFAYFFHSVGNTTVSNVFIMVIAFSWMFVIMPTIGFIIDSF